MKNILGKICPLVVKQHNFLMDKFTSVQSDPFCPICQVQKRTLRSNVTLRCGHTFCNDCIGKLLYNHNLYNTVVDRCPVCRVEITTDESVLIMNKIPMQAFRGMVTCASDRYHGRQSIVGRLYEIRNSGV